MNLKMTPHQLLMELARIEYRRPFCALVYETPGRWLIYPVFTASKSEWEEILKASEMAPDAFI